MSLNLIRLTPLIHHGSRAFKHTEAWRNTVPITAPDSRLFSGASSKAEDGEKSISSVGFIGIGNMGFWMASHLLSAGYELTVYDKNTNAMQQMVSQGAAAAQSPSEISANADVVITMLPSSPQVEEVYLGAHGLLSATAAAAERTQPSSAAGSSDFSGGARVRTRLFVDTSTVAPRTSQKIAAAAQKCVIADASAAPMLVDAPVSGGVVGAHEKTLTFMVGGGEAAVEAATPILQNLGTRIIHCGPPGAGAAAKLCNNLALAAQMAGVAEAMALGQKLGLDLHMLRSVFNTSSARSWSSEEYSPVPGLMAGVPSSRLYAGGFSNRLMAKDLGLALEAGKQVGATAPVAEVIHNLYQGLCEGAHGGDDFSSIFMHIYRGRGLDVKG